MSALKCLHSCPPLGPVSSSIVQGPAVQKTFPRTALPCSRFLQDRWHPVMAFCSLHGYAATLAILQKKECHFFWTWVIFLAYKSNGISQWDIFMCCCVCNMNSKLPCTTDKSPVNCRFFLSLRPGSQHCLFQRLYSSFSDIVFLRTKILCVPVLICEYNPSCPAIYSPLWTNESEPRYLLWIPSCLLHRHGPLSLIFLFLACLLRVKRFFQDIIGDANVSPLNSLTVFEDRNPISSCIFRT